ncbi:MAG TPA: hypothetical protein VM260_03075 [Pirellula sp.]|nr:hypothetical protein [Pirellula sp.]
MLSLLRAWNRSIVIKALTLWPLACSLLVLGQDTIQFGFEEYPVESTPPFVTPGFLGGAKVYASTTPFIQIQPFEGQKFLFGGGQIRIASPDGQLIQSFTLHAFGLGPNEGIGRSFFDIGNQRVLNFGSWQTVQDSFVSPVPYIQISCFNFETIGTSFGIDAVQFVTIPEPRTLWLLAFSPLLFARNFRRRKANPT